MLWAEDGAKRSSVAFPATVDTGFVICKTPPIPPEEDLDTSKPTSGDVVPIPTLPVISTLIPPTEYAEASKSYPFLRKSQSKVQ